MKRIFIATLAVLCLALPAFGQPLPILGFDQGDAGTSCDLDEMGITDAVAGQQYSMDIVLNGNMEPLVLYGVIFGTPDASDVSSVSFVHNSAAMPAWVPTPLSVAPDVELTPGFLAYKTASGQAWKADATDFNFVGTTPVVLGTLNFTAEVNGCISFGIDPGNGADLGSAFLDVVFSFLPFTVCAPNVCFGDQLHIASSNPPCPIPSATNGDPYAGATFLATGGIPPYLWSASGLPAGLDINGSSGTIEGTPNDTLGVFNFAVVVTDLEVTDQRTCQLTLLPDTTATGIQGGRFEQSSWTDVKELFR